MCGCRQVTGRIGLCPPVGPAPPALAERAAIHAGRWVRLCVRLCVHLCVQLSVRPEGSAASHRMFAAWSRA